jgi:hypothetical protein
VKEVNNDRQHEDEHEEPCAAGCGSRHEQEDGADDLAPTQNLSENVGHVSAGEVVAGSRHDEHHGFDENYNA